MIPSGNSIHPLAADLDHILDHTGKIWEELRGQRIFITGGTGFFGRWLLHSFVWANTHLSLKATAVVLTRDPEAFRRNVPDLAADAAISLHQGDVRTFSFPDGPFSHIIHAATTSAVATFNNEDPLRKFDTVVEGTRHTLDFAVRCQARKFLMTSSGAVYGRQPIEMTHIPEDFAGAPDSFDPKAALGEGKRAAEFLCAYYAGKHGIETKIARCFSFVGPYLQLDIHYAIGNFIRDAMAGGPIRVHGDGTARRSYLYAADLMVWLWTILFKGGDRAVFNVGSENDLSIAELAHVVAACAPTPTKVLLGKAPVQGTRPDRYIPSTQRARIQLGLAEHIPLQDAIRRTFSFLRSTQAPVQDARGTVS